MSLNTLLIWALIAFLAVIDAVWMAVENVALQPAVLLPTFIPIIVTGFLAWFYTRIRRDPRIATLAHMIAISLAFTAVTMVLSYIMVGLKRPLVDSYLIDFDRSLGFDWPTMYGFVAAHPALHIVLKIIYLSLVPQMVLLLLIFNFHGQFGRAWELQWLFFLICLGCIVFSGLWPAAGAFGAFHIQMDEPYVQEFAALRDGTLKVIGNGGVQGVIQFPSLHTALAVLYIYMARGQRFLFPLLLILNILVIISTPAIGGHHFADLVGGALLAAVVIGLSRLLAARTNAQNKSADLSAGT
jgi:membrane-associated phospholipid phosphatase